jgi:hypothetical protein
MKKDISDLKGEDVVIASAPAQASKYVNFWSYYLNNLKEKPIKNVLVNSKGYGEIAMTTSSTFKSGISFFIN